jgi:hypothetical protein
MFSEDLNSINAFWIKNPEATMVDTLKFAMGNCFLSDPIKQEEIDKILEEYDKFSKRRWKKIEEADHWSKDYESPLGSNPFMENFEDDC